MLLARPRAPWRRTMLVAALGTLAVAIPSTVTAQNKRPLTIDDYERWKAIEGATISSDGAWVAYTLRHTNTLDTRPVLHLERLDSETRREVIGGSRPVFSEDAKWLAAFLDLPY